MIFTTEEFFEVAIESWPEWDLSPQPVIQVAKQQCLFVMPSLTNCSH